MQRLAPTKSVYGEAGQCNAVCLVGRVLDPPKIVPQCAYLKLLVPDLIAQDDGPAKPGILAIIWRGKIVKAVMDYVGAGQIIMVNGELHCWRKTDPLTGEMSRHYEVQGMRFHLITTRDEAALLQEWGPSEEETRFADHVAEQDWALDPFSGR